MEYCELVGGTCEDMDDGSFNMVKDFDSMIDLLKDRWA